MAEQGKVKRDEQGHFEQGTAKGPGRKPGGKNAINKEIVEDVLQAYRELGGVEYLKSLPKRLFVRLLEKTMPAKIDLETQDKMTWAEMIEKLRQTKAQREQQELQEQEGRQL